MPKLELKARTPPRFAFREVGRSKATTFTGLCARHDQELFRPIEIKPINLTDLHHVFLIAYRALLKEAHASRKAAVDTQLVYQKGVEEGLYPKDDTCAPGMLATEHLIAAFLIEGIKQRYDDAFRSKEWRRIDHKVLELDVEPKLAVSSVFSTNIYSKTTDAPAFVALNVFPVRRKVGVVFSFLAEERPQVCEALGGLWSMTGHRQQYELSKLILRKCENFVLAPGMFDAFSEHRKQVIGEYFERNIGQHTYDLEDPDLFLFAEHRDTFT